MENFKIELTKAEGWYSTFDDSTFIKIDGYYRSPMGTTVFHITDSDAEWLKKKSWYEDTENKDKEIRTYETLEECKEAERLRASFEDSKRELERSEKIKKIRELTKGLYRDEWEKVLDGESIVSVDVLDSLYAYKSAYKIKKDGFFTFSLDDDEHVSVNLDSVIRATYKDKAISVVLPENKVYVVKKSKFKELYNALKLIYFSNVYIYD